VIGASMSTLIWVSTGLLLGAVAIVVASLRKQQTRHRRGLALLAATERGDVEAMRLLLAAGAPVNTRNAQGWTPLHVAAAGGDLAVVSLLLTHGAEVNATSNIGTTPLYNAIRRSGKRAVIDMLLAHGAVPEDQCGLGY
jgi:hypothetical protein